MTGSICGTIAHISFLLMENGLQQAVFCKRSEIARLPTFGSLGTKEGRLLRLTVFDTEQHFAVSRGALRVRVTAVVWPVAKCPSSASLMLLVCFKRHIRQV